MYARPARTNAVLRLIVILLPGCTAVIRHGESNPPLVQREGGASVGLGSKSRPLSNTSGRGIDRPVVIQSVHFQVLRIRGPAGLFSRSERIWNMLDENVLPIDQRALLARNGLRVAVGRQETWPEIKAILDGEQVEAFADQKVVQDGYPLPLFINTQPHLQTLFLIRPDGSMPGARFPQSTMALRLGYTVPVDEPDSVEVQLIPEVRLPPYRPPPTLTEHGWTEYPSIEQGRPLWELACQVRVAPEQFLVVGPSSMVQQPHLTGTLLLCEKINGRDYESACFITPKLQRFGPIE